MQGLWIGKYSLYQNTLQLHLDSQAICSSLWYLMCLSARIRSTVEQWDDAINGQDADATFLHNISDIYVIVLLHYYLQCSDALMLIGMPMPCSTGP